jgi:hypothetical protein
VRGLAALWSGIGIAIANFLTRYRHCNLATTSANADPC